ncbi:MAG: dihydropteroate synthase [Bryobacter sp.]|nr:dihydropteroate synthase [Bryobacter sp.]
MRRRPIEWKLKSRTLLLGPKTLIVAPISVYPSPTEGAKGMDPHRVFAKALELEEQGADIIDIGAEPTRPGAPRITEAEELQRIMPTLKRMRGKLSVPLCVSTYKSAVAEEALKMGAELINDPSGLTWDPLLAKSVLHYDAGLILNHMRGTPDSWGKLPPAKNLISTIMKDLDAAIHRALRSGIEKYRIVIDPGLTFGKRKEQNYEILGRLSSLAHLGVPVMVGPTRKLLVATSTERELEFAGAAGVTAAILNGAYIVRIHDPAALKPAIAVADGILQQINQ